MNAPRAHYRQRWGQRSRVNHSLCQEEGKSKDMQWVQQRYVTTIMQYASWRSKLGRCVFEAMQLRDRTCHGWIGQTFQKRQVHFSIPARIRRRQGASIHTGSGPWLLTMCYLSKGTLVSLCPREEPGWAGLRVTCLSPQPGEQREEEEEEEWKEEEGKQEVEEKQLEGDNTQSPPGAPL